MSPPYHTPPPRFFNFYVQAVPVASRQFSQRINSSPSGLCTTGSRISDPPTPPPHILPFPSLQPYFLYMHGLLYISGPAPLPFTYRAYSHTGGSCKRSSISAYFLNQPHFLHYPPPLPLLTTPPDRSLQLPFLLARSKIVCLLPPILTVPVFLFEDPHFGF